jgi:hypothetical protein
MESTEPRDKAKTPPSMSPVTLTNFVETHRRTLPSRIDRSLMKSVAGSDQAKILGALEFLDLIQSNGTPTPKFEALRQAGEDEAEVKRAWSSTVEGAFPLMFQGFDLTTATQAMIDERSREEFSISGDTVRKAVAFFLALCRYANIPLSSYVKATRVRSGRPPGAPRRTTPRPKPSDTKPKPPEERVRDDNGETGETKTISLRSGAGTIKLTVSVGWMDLTGADRDFVLKLIDDLKQYENSQGPSAASGSGPSTSGAAES